MRISDWSSDVCSSDLRDAIIESGVKIVETAGNNPHEHMPALKAAGVRVIHKCTTPRHARKAQDIGVDIVSIDRKSVVSGKSVSVRVDLGGGRVINKKKHK